MPSLSALGRGCRVPMSGPGAPGSISAADEGHQELPRGSRSELASLSPAGRHHLAHTCRRASGTHCNQGDRTPEAQWGSQQEGTEGLGKPSGGEEPLERVPGNPIFLWAGGGREMEPCYDWESRVFIQGEGRR